MDLLCLGNEFGCGSPNSYTFGATMPSKVQTNNLRKWAVFGTIDYNLINHALEIGLRIVVLVTVHLSCFLNELLGRFHYTSASITGLFAIKMVRWPLPKLPVNGADYADRCREIDIFDKRVVILITVDLACLGDKLFL